MPHQSEISGWTTSDKKQAWGKTLMPNRKAKDRKRKRRKLNEILKREGRTANQVRRKREREKDNANR